MESKDRQALAPHIRKVLEEAQRGKGPNPHFLTSFQILARLPDVERANLIAKFGQGGAGAQTYYAATSAVAEVLRHDLKDEVERTYVDTLGMLFDIDGEPPVKAGYPVAGLYRLQVVVDDAP